MDTFFAIAALTSFAALSFEVAFADLEPHGESAAHSALGITVAIFVASLIALGFTAV